jgi:ADP-heptose:LPS heptosyltransferase
MRTITVTGERQPILFRQLLQSLVANDLTDWRIFIQIDPSPLAGHYVGTAAQWLGHLEYTLTVNPRSLGARENAFRLLERVFGDGSALNINLAEATLAAADVTHLARWYADHHRPEWLCLSLASMAGLCGLASDRAYPDLLFPTKEFDASGFVVRREEWYRHFQHRELVNDKPDRRLDESLLSGWDGSIRRRLLQTGNFVSLRPVTVRVTPAGAERAGNGGAGESDGAIAAMAHLPCQHTARCYQVVDPGELPDTVRTQLPAQDLVHKLLGAIAHNEEIVNEQDEALARLRREADERTSNLSLAVAKSLTRLRRTALPDGSRRFRIWENYVRQIVKRLIIGRPTTLKSPDPSTARAIAFQGLPRLVCGKDSPLRILVLKLDHIGDLLLSISALSLLRQAWPGAHLTLVCGPWNVKLASQFGMFDEIHPCNFFARRSGEGINAGIKEFRELPLGDYDLAIDLRHDADARHVLNFVRARYRAGFVCDPRFPVRLDLAIPDLEYVTTLETPRTALHSETRLVTLLSAIIATFGPDEGCDARALIASRPPIRYFDRGPVVALAPGTGNPIKQWGVERFSGVARTLNEEAGCRFVLIGGDADKADAELIAAALPADQCVNAAGTLDIADVALALEAVDVFIGNDTGTTHMAALMGIPTVNIFSGVVDVNIWRAKGPNVVTLYAPVSCAPCRLAKREDCPYGQVCLTSISEDDVVRSALSLLRRSESQGAPREILTAVSTTAIGAAAPAVASVPLSAVSIGT